MLRRVSALAVTCAVLGLVAACDDGPSGVAGTASLTVALTDAPLPDGLLASAIVDVGRIEIIPSDGPPMELTMDGGSHDLLTLQDGVTAELASLEIPAACYLQLRLYVNEAEVTLGDGYEFASGDPKTHVLAVPSGAASGIKINLRAADGDLENGGNNGACLEINSGETLLVVVDMDVSQNFVVRGVIQGSDPAIVPEILFTPLLRAVLNDVAASISGVVSTETEHSLEGLQVTATLVTDDPGDDFMTDMASGDVDPATGEYTVRFLAPGTYDVTVAGLDMGFETDPTERTITIAPEDAVTGADFEIVASP